MYFWQVNSIKFYLGKIIVFIKCVKKGSNPSIGKNTRVSLTVTGDREFMQRDKSDWDIRTHHQDGNILTLQISVSPTAPVGVWSCEIQHGNEIHHCRDDIYILFNPYCSGK